MWYFDPLQNPTTATSTLLVFAADQSQEVHVIGTGFTYGGNNLIDGGIITGYELYDVSNPGSPVLLQSVTIDGPALDAATVFAELGDALTLRNTIAGWGFEFASVLSGTANEIILLGTDGTRLVIEGSGFSPIDLDVPPTGTITSIIHQNANGLPIPGQSISDANIPCSALYTSYGDSVAIYNNMFAGPNTVVQEFDTYFNPLEGGPGDDTLSGRFFAENQYQFPNFAAYNGSAAGVTIDLNLAGTTDAEGNILLNAQAQNTGGAGVDTLWNISGVVGSGFADTITGTGNGEVFLAGDGDDTVHAGDGDDSLGGGAGADVLDGGAGLHDAAMYGESPVGITVDLAITGPQSSAGDANGDTLSNIEWLWGSNFADTLSGDANQNNLNGNGGDDTIYGRGGADYITGGIGNDTLYGGDGDDTIFGGEGLDPNNPADGNDLVDGGAGNDVLRAGSGNDTFNGGVGVDTGLFSAALSNYTVVRNGVMTTVSGADGTDRLTSVEVLDFANTDVGNIFFTGNFNGSGGTDLLLQNGSALAQWQLIGTAIQPGSGNVSTLGSGWTAIGSGDLNGNGTDDLLLQNGQTLALWQMNGTAIDTGSGNIGTLGAGWMVTGIDDFNNNGTDDLLLQNGQTLALWQMNGTAIDTGSGNIGTLGSGWAVAGTGDFTGNGTADILLQNGQNLAVWSMNGTAIQPESGIIGTLGSGWMIAGVADFTNDGHADILLQNGQNLGMWTIDGTAIQPGSGNIGTLGAGWTIAGNGDFNNDGYSDLLLQNGQQLAEWLLHGTQLQPGSGNIGTLGSGWSLA